MGWWGFAGTGIGMVLFLALVIVGTIALIRISAGSSTAAGGSGIPPQQYPSPEAVLADRFARGEIDDNDYQNRLRLLRDQASP